MIELIGGAAGLVAAILIITSIDISPNKLIENVAFTWILIGGVWFGVGFGELINVIIDASRIL